MSLQLRCPLYQLALLAAAAATVGCGGPRAPAAEPGQPLQETLQLIQQRLASLDDRVQQLTRMVSQDNGGGGAAESVRQCALSCAEGRDCLVVDYRAPDNCRPLEKLATCDRAGGAASGYFVSVAQTCARTCLQLLRQKPSSRDGLYHLHGLTEPVFCDMSRDGGGWTLLLTANSQDGWSLDTLMEREAARPALDHNYSILQHADSLKAAGKGARFQYRLEAQAQSGRGRWGGVWSAPRSYSFTHQLTNQTDVRLEDRFDNWKYDMNSIQQRLPWVNAGGYAGGKPLLTTSDQWRSGAFWGTLVTRPEQRAYRHSPWVYGTAAQHSGTVLYWLREEPAS
ncbi:uncharacterized protein LOC122386098 isoform X1 [Amphibalanus amphitrite]|nr:uncharacterized protein LOC122386098 isoform X1 [Amphibalanus amphitrite]XP_043230858.1 uncharacterized protein LOC122386098 isoform X1 [Amphibalanus amphitrite]XP_043230860.1 uncharacterized protein LOC122386098 isoform X1 [Amphibalanus amphitrite]XP_043230863.1 uncharacterized protein LOC122386098 isoform X1 [Amphibalanus amphitrite]